MSDLKKYVADRKKRDRGFAEGFDARRWESAFK
jgi:hypothetical protein